MSWLDRHGLGCEEQARGGEAEAAEMERREPQRPAAADDGRARLGGQRGRSQAGLGRRQWPRPAAEAEVLAAGRARDAVGRHAGLQHAGRAAEARRRRPRQRRHPGRHAAQLHEQVGHPAARLESRRRRRDDAGLRGSAGLAVVTSSPPPRRTGPVHRVRRGQRGRAARLRRLFPGTVGHGRVRVESPGTGDGDGNRRRRVRVDPRSAEETRSRPGPSD